MATYTKRHVRKAAKILLMAAYEEAVIRERDREMATIYRQMGRGDTVALAAQLADSAWEAYRELRQYALKMGL